MDLVEEKHKILNESSELQEIKKWKTLNVIFQKF